MEEADRQTILALATSIQKLARSIDVAAQTAVVLATERAKTDQRSVFEAVFGSGRR